MKTCVFDIETSALEAIGAGVLLCAVVKPVKKREIVFRADEYNARFGDEWKLVQAVITALSEFDLWVGHNCDKFDIPWLRSRSLFFNLGAFPRPFTYDTIKAFRRLGYKTVMNGFGKPSAGLGHAVDFFGFEQEKTSIYPRRHWEVVWGDANKRREAMGELVNHNRADVLMTERLYDALLPEDNKASIKRLL